MGPCSVCPHPYELPSRTLHFWKLGQTVPLRTRKTHWSAICLFLTRFTRTYTHLAPSMLTAWGLHIISHQHSATSLIAGKHASFGQRRFMHFWRKEGLVGRLTLVADGDHVPRLPFLSHASLVSCRMDTQEGRTFSVVVFSRCMGGFLNNPLCACFSSWRMAWSLKTWVVLSQRRYDRMRHGG